jgi:hypothetical protein
MTRITSLRLVTAISNPQIPSTKLTISAPPPARVTARVTIGQSPAKPRTKPRHTSIPRYRDTPQVRQSLPTHCTTHCPLTASRATGLPAALATQTRTRPSVEVRASSMTYKLFSFFICPRRLKSNTDRVEHDNGTLNRTRYNKLMQPGYHADTKTASQRAHPMVLGWGAPPPRMRACNSSRRPNVTTATGGARYPKSERTGEHDTYG